jgi:hypothetical protein
VLTAATVCTRLSIGNGLFVGNTKLENDLLLGESKGLGGVIDTKVNLIRTEYFRHDDF